MFITLEGTNKLKIAVLLGFVVIDIFFKSSFIFISSALEISQLMGFIRIQVDDFNYAVAGAVWVTFVVTVHEVELDVLLFIDKVKRKRRSLITLIVWIFVPHYLSLWMRCVSQSGLWHQ